MAKEFGAYANMLGRSLKILNVVGTGYKESKEYTLTHILKGHLGRLAEYTLESNDSKYPVYIKPNIECFYLAINPDSLGLEEKEEAWNEETLYYCRFTWDQVEAVKTILDSSSEAKVVFAKLKSLSTTPSDIAPDGIYDF